MCGKYKTIDEATRAWVREFNAYPESMIECLMKQDIDDWTEITEPCIGDRVYHNLPTTSSSGEVYDIYNDGDGNIKYNLKLDDGTFVDCERDDFDVLYDDVLPMWDTMWSFDDCTDIDWFECGDGIRKMSGCGFRIYHHEEWGYFFGIDGAGYSFYENHWIPLYKARGLRWHDEGE
jgi:hypothetical protein